MKTKQKTRKSNLGLFTYLEYNVDPDIERIKEYLNAGCDINAQNKNGQTALMRVCGATPSKDSPENRRCFEAIKFLVENGADVNIRSGKESSYSNDLETGWTALMHAVFYSHTEVVKYLLDNGAIICPQNPDDHYNATAITLSVEHKKIEIFKLLVQSEKRLDIVEILGTYLLNIACQKGCAEIAEYLINKNVDVNIPEGMSGMTPLHKACFNGYDRVVKLLLENGAKLDIKDADGRSVLDYLKFNDYTGNKCVKHIKKHLQEKQLEKTIAQINNPIFSI